MPDIEKAEHAKLRVEEFEPALEFYRDVMGMVEIERSGDTVYLGCGLDENFDLALERGETGVDHLAMRVSSEEELDVREAQLEANGVETWRTDGDEPGQVLGVQFELPTGVTMEFVTVEDYTYRFPMNPALPERGDVAPLDMNHFQLVTNDVEALAEFLVDNLAFRISEIIPDPENPDKLAVAWTRYGSQHHDVAVVHTDKQGYEMHHLALTMANYEHMKRFADTAVRNGADIEIGPSRHTGGSNLYTYFWAPGGIRWELVAEMVNVDEGMETMVSKRENTPFDCWGMYDIPDTWTDLIGDR